MKTFLIIACFIALTVADDGNFIQNAMKECAQTARLTQEGYNNHDIKDEKYQIFSGCMLTKLTILQNGVIDVTNLKGVLQKANVDCSFLDECAQKKGDSKGEDYATIYNCLMSNWPKK